MHSIEFKQSQNYLVGKETTPVKTIIGEDGKEYLLMVFELEEEDMDAIQTTRAIKLKVSSESSAKVILSVVSEDDDEVTLL